MDYPVMEIFGPTIQGEGPWIGRRTMFIRFFGCDYKCVWCDSKETWKQKFRQPRMSPKEIVSLTTMMADEAGCHNVVFTGGNPCLYDLTPVLEAFGEGWTFSVETQGSRHQSWLFTMDSVVISPKGPSSGMIDEIDLVILEKCLRTPIQGNAALKCVVFTVQDYEFAKQLNHMFPEFSMYLSAGTYCPEFGAVGSRNPVTPKAGNAPGGMIDSKITLVARAKWLAEQVMQDDGWRTDPFVLPQYHVMLWGHKKGI